MPLPDRHIPNIPITVFTGFLGAGKTSIILSLLPKLPKDYRVVLLKNEFGDIEGKIPTAINRIILNAASSRQSACKAIQFGSRQRNPQWLHVRIWTPPLDRIKHHVQVLRPRGSDEECPLGDQR